MKVMFDLTPFPNGIYQMSIKYNYICIYKNIVINLCMGMEYCETLFNNLLDNELDTWDKLTSHLKENNFFLNLG